MSSGYSQKDEVEDDENLDLQRALADSLREYNERIEIKELVDKNETERNAESELMSSPKIGDLLEYLDSIRQDFVDVLLHGNSKSQIDVECIERIIWGDETAGRDNKTNIDKLELGESVRIRNTYDCMDDSELETLPFEKAETLMGTILGTGDNMLSQKEDICRWVNHTLSFQFNRQINTSNDDGFFLMHDNIININNCLIQQGGGPCGIISSLNGLIIMQLIFNQKRIRNEPNLVNYSNNVPEKNCWESLIESICIILFQSTVNSEYKVIQFKNVDINKLEFQLYYVEYKNIMQVYNYYVRRLEEGIFSTKGSLFSLLLTIVGSRTADRVKSDMDDPYNPLIGLYGQCNQELVNLCITGTSVSNVFDGIKTLDGSSDSFVLKGIQKKSLIGYLTEHETLRYCTVGLNYKYPLFPIWIVCNKNHYKCCFTFNFTECILSPYQELTQRMERSFQKYDLDNSGFILEHQIHPFLFDVGMHNYLYEIRNLSENGIVLWNDLRDYILNSKQVSKNNKDKFELWTRVYLFDGQKENGVKIIKSTIFNLEDVAKVRPIYNKYRANGHNSTSTKNKTCEEIDFVSILQTRWGKETVIDTELSLININGILQCE